MDIKRAYRFRFYPTPNQEVILTRTFGCARYVYNHMPRMRSDAWMNTHKSIGYHATSALLTQLKKEPDRLWLNEVSSVPLQQSLRHLQAVTNSPAAKPLMRGEVRMDVAAVLLVHGRIRLRQTQRLPGERPVIPVFRDWRCR
ncbi:helix-turn-helix domain-containing protein [Acidiferrobacter sp. SPIII_3]|uniref:helix-turn-helix domain-containing protein n=1 Tax=Acidiferrobacter sp. SPIII_3 TaxID=1281578 RepID=UPI00197AC805|nr:helix-turn-helix domain-containing protein [Acidiferrobacter sp. SPIII_3]